MQRASIVAEIFRMIWHRRTWVLLPPMVILVLVGALIVLTQSAPLAPFLYPLF